MDDYELLSGEVINLRLERIGVYFASTCGMEAQVCAPAATITLWPSPIKPMACSQGGSTRLRVIRVILPTSILTALEESRAPKGGPAQSLVGMPVWLKSKTADTWPAPGRAGLADRHKLPGDHFATAATRRLRCAQRN